MILIWFSLKLTLAERGCERKLIYDFYGSYTGLGGGAVALAPPKENHKF